jgi:glyoxylase-like metal-dependent hydrolase (beta-lactamase superfamily II)
MTTPLKKTVFALLAAASLAVPAAYAAAPMAKSQPAGYYRIMLGDFEVTPLSDGTLDLPVDKLLREKPAQVEAALAKSFLKLPVETSVNGFLVNTGSKLVLIDSGSGTLWGPTAGKLVANLKAAGYQPEQVDEIYITHFHGDHVGGLVSGGKPAFPNATIRANKAESDYWLSQASLDKAPADAKGDFQMAMGMLKPYVAAGKFKPFDGDTMLVPGVSSHAAKGHTPGHTVYVVESGGQKLVLVGDLIHVAAVQMDDPTVTIAFDNDENAARAARLKEFAAAAKAGALVGGAHLQFPGLGHLRAEGKGYRWVPVNYTRMR